MASILPGLRRAAPRLSRDFFICHQCRTNALPLGRLKLPVKANVKQSIRFNSSAAAFPEANKIKNSPLTSLSKTIYQGSEAKPEIKKSFFPKTSSNTVAYWLLGSAASVFGIVVFGGLTRLTESGLSITEWRPVTGSLPPLSADDWNSEFTKYQASPEFKLLNAHMTLEEFKKIYYMEWGHRLWGRVVGLSFVLPAIYFVATKKVAAHMSLRLLGIAGLIGFQGALGWYMVKSGLHDDLFAPGSHPRVSQYRLTAHLGAAFVCYSAMLWNGLAILRQNKALLDPERARSQLQRLPHSKLAFFRRSVAGLALLVFITAMSGGLVAGLDAGLIYNEFPYMGNGLHPPASELFSDFYCRKEDKSDLWWRNLLENPSTVQLNHRALATITFTSIISLWAYARFNRYTKLNGPLRKGMLGVVHLALLQVALGISTLIYMVPIPLAAAHQAGSLALLTGTLVLGSRVWIPKRTMSLCQAALKPGHVSRPLSVSRTLPAAESPGTAKPTPITPEPAKVSPMPSVISKSLIKPKIKFIPTEADIQHLKRKGTVVPLPNESIVDLNARTAEARKSLPKEPKKEKVKSVGKGIRGVNVPVAKAGMGMGKGGALPGKGGKGKGKK